MAVHLSILSSGQRPQAVTCSDSKCSLLHCPLCPRYTGDYPRVEAHIQSHLKTAVHHGEYVMFTCNLDCRSDSHYHCCECGRIYPRRKAIIKHLGTCQSRPLPQSQPLLASLPLPRASSSSNVRRVQCTICHLELNKKNLKEHMRRQHPIVKEDISVDRYLACECLDIDMGIYAVKKSFNSNSAPIHVQKKTSGMNHLIMCPLDSCHLKAEVMRRSGFGSYDCVHIQSLKYCPPSSPSNIELKGDILGEIVSSRWFSEEKKRLCLLRQQAAREKGTPFSIEVKVGSSIMKKFVSVYEPQLTYCNNVGRVMVMLDTVKNTWHCHCAARKQACIHKCIARWHLFQTMKEHFLTNGDDDIDDSDVPDEEPELEYNKIQEDPCKYPPQGEDLRRTVTYIHINKKLPGELPSYFSGLSSEADLPKHLIPKEEVCPECPGNIPLGEPIIITQAAKIITVKGVIEGVATYCKKCSSCGLIIRYQEWEDGVHNFNDRIILTLHFCIYLRNCLQTHTALGRAIETLELTSQQKFPNKNTVIHAYLHFEALSDHQYDFCCVRCGYYPPVVVMDLHKSCVFSLAVSELEDPPIDYNGEVDIDEFWTALSLERIARGFVTSDRQNPFAVAPTYHRWAPWIGRHTRKSNMVLNTEFEKVHASRPQKECAEIEITEDRLLDEISNLKVHAIRKLCKECKIDSKGSKMELIMRLRHEMATRSKYDKIFQKVWGASGGWAVIMCPCGQVLSLKFNIRAESPRDFTDLLLSWKHLPNICIYDFARGLAVHANLREPVSLPFSPHEGRLLDPSPTNIQLASGGGTVNLPWLMTKKTFPDPNGHPLTGSQEHYCLYDTFHERNTKDPSDVLRRIGLVPELTGRINSQVAEQLFSVMKKNNYFMNMYSPSTHVFMMRNIIHHYNRRRNQAIMEDLKNLVSPEIPITLNEFGQAEFFLSSSTTPSGTAQANASPPTKRSRLELVSATEAMPCWRKTLHASVSGLLDYVLDTKGNPYEAFVLANHVVLQRSDFWSLGLQRNVEASIANCCFKIITNIASDHGIATMAVDAYVVVTWLPPYSDKPQDYMISDFLNKDVVLLPAWQPEHWTLC
ncbi:unnamed protein product [Knipowitschia caucasica]